MRLLPGILSVVLFLTSSLASRADWPQFLGPERNGTVDEPAGSKLTREFGAEGPLIAWKYDLGSGFAGPVIAGNRVLVFHRKGDEAIVQALDFSTGKPLWNFAYDTGYRDQFGFDNGPRSSPTVAENEVFTYGAEGMIHCLDLTTGKKRWSVDAVAKFASPTGFFGRACAPLVVNDLVVLNVGGTHLGKPAGVVALSRKNGSLVWQSDNHEASYSSPVATSLQGKLCVVLFTRHGLLGLDASTGKEYFSSKYRPRMSASVNAAAPILTGNAGVFLSTCYNVGASLWRVEEGMKLKVVWSGEGKLDAHYATPVLVGAHLFGFHGRQETGQVLRCIEMATGKVQWSSPPLAAGSLIAVGKTLFAVTEKGELLLIDADPAKYAVHARGQILRSGGRPIPAFSRGFLLARDGRQLVCVDLRKK